MFKRFTLAAAALAMGTTALIPATPAAAQRYDGYYGQRYDRGYNRYNDRYSNDRYSETQYDGRYNDRGYQDYRRYKKCKNQGTAGTIIGAIAGGLLGRSLRGDNATGSIIGGAAGALAGRAIDKSDRPGYCR